MHLYQLLPSLIDDDSIVPKRKANEAIQPGREGMSQVKNCPTCGAKTADKITWDKQAKMTMGGSPTVPTAVTRDVRL
jgi:hypothetical protein